jgi:ActR/RegA family two-component response regulator
MDCQASLGRILMVGPRGADRERLQVRFETLGYVCDCVESHEDAIGVMTTMTPDILAIGDTSPSALRLIRDVQATVPSARAIIYGGSPTPEALVEAVRGGASDWISLPEDRARIPERMEQIMARVRAHRGRDAHLEALTENCKRLSEARDEMSDQVDVLCSDLASAYRSMRTQMSDVAMSSEFKAIMSQELDVEDMLRTSLEYILKRIGPTNAVVYLREGDTKYGVGAYVNYQWQDEDLMPMLTDLGGIICEPMSSERDLVQFNDTAEFANAAGGNMQKLAGSEVASFACHNGDECMAVFALFRDADTGFDDEHAATLDVLRAMIAEQLSRIVRIHKRSRPEWPDEPADEGWDLAA